MIELSLEQVRSMFDKKTFDRGMEYYKENRVQNVRHTVESGLPKMDCQVQGDGFYQVTIKEQEKGRLLCGCGCIQFHFYNTCKHLAAAMIHCAQHPKGRGGQRLERPESAENLHGAQRTAGAGALGCPGAAQAHDALPAGS